MQEVWSYLLLTNTAPVWIGEFGAPAAPAPRQPSDGDMHYWNNLLRYLETVDADFGYWALNPRKPHGNGTDEYGLLEDDWVTVVWDYRLEGLRRLMT